MPDTKAQGKEASGMKQEELFGLMERFEAGSITRLEFEANGTRIVLEKGGAYAPAPSQSAPVPAREMPAKEAEPQEGPCIKTPLVGTFYAASEPGKPPFVKAGDTVKKGQTVCIIEAMKMINEVPAPCDCVIEKALAQDGVLVGFNEPLFLIREL